MSEPLRHFLDIGELDAGTLRGILDRAGELKANGRDARLAGKTLAMIFDKPSTRTRVSFEVAIKALGGDAVVLNSKDMQLGRGETIADTARVLSRYVDAIMIRTFEETTLQELADNAAVPVINGLTNASHPCQIMADVMTYEEQRGPIGGAKVVWSGDGNNVCASFLHAAGQFGFDMVFTGPPQLDPSPAAVAFARERGARIEIERNPVRAAEGADLVVTDTWVSMHDSQSAKERRHALLRPYQVNAALMAAAKPGALFMHCLPAHREEEVTNAVMDGPHSVVFDEAENRLHVQKAILRWCLGV
jgi:ornithine carbamoyltransferase